MNKALLIVDVQKGFINKYTKHIPEIVEKNNIYMNMS